MHSDLQITIVSLIILQYCVERVLAKLNASKMKGLKDVLPVEISNLMNLEEWKKCTNYNLEKYRFSLIEDTFGVIFLILVFLGVFPYYLNSTLFDDGSSLFKSAALCISFILIIQVPLIPFDWMRQFSLEQKYGFNTNTQTNWLLDKLKEMVIGFCLGWILLTVMLFLHKWGVIYFPSFWWLIAFLVFFTIQILLMVLWPKFILPLFNELTPLKDPELSEKLFALASKTGFKTSAIEVIDGSKRSRHSNAFFTGFGKFRRVVLFDTLLDQMNHQQVEAVLAHEIGHYKLGHIPKRILISFITGLAFFALLGFLCAHGWIYKELMLADKHIGTLVPLIITFTLVGNAFTFWFNPASNYFSRKHEFDADAFAAHAVGEIDSLSSALRKLYVENLSYPIPHKWVSTFHYSHPTLFEREAALRQMKIQ